MGKIARLLAFLLTADFFYYWVINETFWHSKFFFCLKVVTSFFFIFDKFWLYFQMVSTRDVPVFDQFHVTSIWRFYQKAFHKIDKLSRTIRFHSKMSLLWFSRQNSNCLGYLKVINHAMLFYLQLDPSNLLWGECFISLFFDSCWKNSRLKNNTLGVIFVTFSKSRQ